MVKPNPHALTPAEEAQVKSIAAQLVLNRLLVAAIIAYGVYDFITNYTPLAVWIYGFFAWLAWSMRPVMPNHLRSKIKRFKDSLGD